MFLEIGGTCDSNFKTAIYETKDKLRISNI